MPKSKYFIAIIPPEEVLSATEKIKDEFAIRFRSHKARNAPAHITIHMPFEYRDDHIERIFEGLIKKCLKINSFEIELENYDCFPPRVIFVNVKENALLRDFHYQINDYLRKHFHLLSPDRKDGGFHPHLTVAFRDIKKDAFYQAWNEFQYRKFYRKFECNKLSLLKHNGKNWEVLKEFPLFQ